eukprot:gene9789-10788_t
MTSANKVADIFSAAGEAFSRLGALAMELQQLGGDATASHEEGKWGDEEIDMLRQAVLRFGTDLEKISTQIKSKSVGQIRAALKQKAMQQKVGLTPTKPTSTTTVVSHADARVSIEHARAAAGGTPNKRIRIEDGKMVANRDNLMLASSGIDDSSIIQSALNKLKYEKDPTTHADIDIEG